MLLDTELDVSAAALLQGRHLLPSGTACGCCAARPACLPAACCHWAAVLTCCLRCCWFTVQEEQRELAKTIRVSGSILLSTVSNFLDFFKIGAWGSMLALPGLPYQACLMPWRGCVAHRWLADHAMPDRLACSRHADALRCNQSAQPSPAGSVLTSILPRPPLQRRASSWTLCAARWTCETWSQTCTASSRPWWAAR